MDWNEETIAALRQMWSEGMSASQVARQLGGGVSRNAVIGKVHRLGLSGREAPSRPRSLGGRPPGSKTQNRAAANAAPVRAAVAAAVAEAPKMVASTPVAVPPVLRPAVVCEDKPSATILTLGEHACRWPIGDPDQGDFGFCGARRLGRGPYCEGHSGVSMRKKAKPMTAESLAKWLGDRPARLRPSSLREALF
ncbi:GcrA family cell cycle regulator [Caulobacter sp. KR2-114]|uniref:GcrA family cell cycle regulator n=1 Tax=Caulobacter sp. KR2-114 TaxID=3400912 RepID=UPI003C0F3AF1